MHGRRPLACLVAALMALVPLASSLPVSAEEEPSAVERFSACVAGAGQGDVLVLFDESGSLKKSDPDAARVTAGRHLITSLADFADRAGADLQLRMAGFGTQFRPYGDWSGLTPATADAALAEMDRFAGRNGDLGTDYWLGLDGARQSLAARAASGGGRCQAIVFFSDGKLDIQRGRGEDDFHRIDRPYDPGNGLGSQAEQQAATESAATSLCRPGGLADQLRSQGVITLGVGLTSTTEPGDLDLMRRVVTGRSDSATCGQELTPSPGDFVTAADIDELLWGFSSLTRTDTPQTTPVCVGAECAEGTRTFVLDQSVNRVDILGTSDVDGATVVLTAPSGERAEITRTPDRQTNPLTLGAPGTFEWLSNRSLSIQLSSEGASQWAGAWSLTFVSPASAQGKQSKTSINVTGDLVPAWQPDAQHPLRIGARVPLDVRVHNGRGEVVDTSALLGDARLDISLLDASGARVTSLDTLGKQQIGQPATLDLTTAQPGRHTLRLLLNVTTAAATKGDGTQVPGTALSPQALDIPVDVLPPAGYPTVASTLTFGRVEGAVAATAELALTGPGCVWIAPDATRITASPDGMTDLAVGSEAFNQQTCVTVADGTTGVLPVTLSSEAVGNGGVSGAVTVSMVPLEEPRTVRTVDVPFTADLSTPLNQPAFWLVLLAALVLGPGVPLALMYAYKFLLASKLPSQLVNVVDAPITIRDGRVLRDGGPLAFRLTDKSVYSVKPGGTRRLAVGAVDLVARLGASPFGAGYVVVEAPGQIGLSDHRPEPHGRRQQAVLPLAVQDHWVLLVTPGVCDRAELLLFTGSLSTDAAKRRLIESAEASVPHLLTEHCGTPAPEPGGDDGAFDSSPTPSAEAADPFDPFA